MRPPKTIIIDIDGTLLYHHGDAVKQARLTPKLLKNVKEQLIRWDKKHYKIILITGRRESERETLQKQLHDVGIFYDQLILNAGRGERILINDSKVGSDKPTAHAFTIKRNQ